MIAKAKAISHGINDIRYITGESQHKKSSGKDLSGIGQSVALRTGRYGNMELHAVDPIPTSTDKEFRYQNRAESIARTYPIL